MNQARIFRTYRRGGITRGDQARAFALFLHPIRWRRWR